MTKEERENAIKMLQDAKYGYKEYLTDEVLDAAIEGLKQIPDWIPVDKDLPLLEKSKIARSDDVLVTDGDDIYIGYLVKREGKTSWHIYEDVNVNIIAWMHSPKKYEPQKKGERQMLQEINEMSQECEEKEL